MCVYRFKGMYYSLIHHEDITCSQPVHHLNRFATANAHVELTGTYLNSSPHQSLTSLYDVCH